MLLRRKSAMSLFFTDRLPEGDRSVHTESRSALSQLSAVIVSASTCRERARMAAYA